MNDKKILPAIILTGIVLSFLINLFVYEPARREILNMELETRRLHEIEREILELQERYDDLAVFVEEKRVEVEDAKKFLPPSIMQDEFIDEIYRAAEFERVRIISVHAGEVNSEEKFQSQVVNVKLESKYISLINFTRKILDGERLTVLENFSATQEGKGIVSCDLSFKIFADVQIKPEKKKSNKKVQK